MDGQVPLVWACPTALGTPGGEAAPDDVSFVGSPEPVWHTITLDRCRSKAQKDCGDYNRVCMDALEEIRLRMRITNLEARMELQEIEIAALNREIGSPLTTLDRKNEARERLDAAWNERADVYTELTEVRRSHPHFRPWI